MTERGVRSLSREAHALTIGPSSIRFNGTSLVFKIDERSSPWPSPIRGEVRVTPHTLLSTRYNLDGVGRHRWQPIAPSARIDVNLDFPSMRWTGDAYCDTNEGDEPLARGVRAWHWMRGTIDDDAVVVYDVQNRARAETSLALRFSKDGRVASFVPPPSRALPSSKWRLSRSARSNGAASVIQSLDDTPFYARSVVSTRLCGRDMSCVHESLDLDRFASPIVQSMLPFRMRRKA